MASHLGTLHIFLAASVSTRHWQRRHSGLRFGRSLWSKRLGIDSSHPQQRQIQIILGCVIWWLYHLLWCTLAKLYRNCLPIKILSHIICTFCDLQDDALNYFIVISNFWYIIFEQPNATAVCLRGLSIYVSLSLAFFCMCVTLLYHRNAWSCSFAKCSSSYLL